MGILLAFAQALCWSATSVTLRSLSTKLDAFLVNGLRASVSLLIILPLVWLTGGPAYYSELTMASVLFLIGSVILGGVFGDALYVMSLKHLGVGRAFAIANSFPLFAVLFGTLLLGTPISVKMMGGVVLVLVGVYIVGRPRGRILPDTGPAVHPPQIAMGVALALIASALWGLSTVIMSLGLQGDVNPVVATSIRVPMVVIISLLVAARRGQLNKAVHLGRRTWLLLIVAGILGWGISGTLYAAAIQLIGPSKTAVISATSPIFAVPQSMLFLHERPTKYVLAGTLMTIVGIILVI